MSRDKTFLDCHTGAIPRKSFLILVTYSNVFNLEFIEYIA